MYVYHSPQCNAMFSAALMETATYCTVCLPPCLLQCTYTLFTDKNVKLFLQHLQWTVVYLHWTAILVRLNFTTIIITFYNVQVIVYAYVVYVYHSQQCRNNCSFPTILLLDGVYSYRVWCTDLEVDTCHLQCAYCIYIYVRYSIAIVRITALSLV
jgi:hypothetical protein